MKIAPFINSGLLPIKTVNKKEVIESLLIAEELGIKHNNFVDSIKKHLPAIELYFGRVAFQTPTLNTKGGLQKVSVACLTEDQAIFIAALSKNTEKVVAFKAKLVKSFSVYRSQLVAEEKNPELSIDKARLAWKRKGKDDAWIDARIQGKVARDKFTKTLGSHGVKQDGFKLCTNAIYTPLWGGDAKAIRIKKGLPEKANTRENMTQLELTSVQFSELLAAENIHKHNITGNKECAAECSKTAKIIAKSIVESRKKAA